MLPLGAANCEGRRSETWSTETPQSIGTLWLAVLPNGNAVLETITPIQTALNLQRCSWVANLSRQEIDSIPLLREQELHIFCATHEVSLLQIQTLLCPERMHCLLQFITSWIVCHPNALKNGGEKLDISVHQKVATTWQHDSLRLREDKIWVKDNNWDYAHYQLQKKFFLPASRWFLHHIHRNIWLPTLQLLCGQLGDRARQVPFIFIRGCLLTRITLMKPTNYWVINHCRNCFYFSDFRRLCEAMKSKFVTSNCCLGCAGSVEQGHSTHNPCIS